MSTPSFSPSASPNPQNDSYDSAGAYADEGFSFQSPPPSNAVDNLSLSSPSSRSPDSLADASNGEIEARALELLASSPPSAKPSALPAAFDNLENLPRALPTSPSEQLDGHTKAVESLRRRLNDAEHDDWMYRTPAAFGTPKAVGLREATGRSDEDDEALGEALGWADRAFNMERYTVTDLPAEEVWLAEDPLRSENDDRFGEGGADWGS